MYLGQQVTIPASWGRWLLFATAIAAIDESRYVAPAQLLLCRNFSGVASLRQIPRRDPAEKYDALRILFEDCPKLGLGFDRLKDLLDA